MVSLAKEAIFHIQCGDSIRKKNQVNGTLRISLKKSQNIAKQALYLFRYSVAVALQIARLLWVGGGSDLSSCCFIEYTKHQHSCACLAAHTFKYAFLLGWLCGADLLKACCSF